MNCACDADFIPVVDDTHECAGCGRHWNRGFLVKPTKIKLDKRVRKLIADEVYRALEKVAKQSSAKTKRRLTK